MQTRLQICGCLTVWFAFPSIAVSQGSPLADTLLLKDFRPKQALIVPQTELEQAKFPVVDAHTHFYFKGRGSSELLDDFIAVMDANNIAVCVSLDGRLGDRFESHRDFLWDQHKDRFVVYANVNWVGKGDEADPSTWDCHQPGFANRTVRQLREAVLAGASGVKIFKRFGLSYKNPDGSLIQVDDTRFDPIWEECGNLGIPIIIHTADPIAFFDPIDSTNERVEELSRHPDWSFHGDKFPSRDELLAARNRMVSKHPSTTFIGAHVGNSSEDLSTASRWLDEMPNLVVEIASRINELGRQPYSSKQFFERYSDRILFGTDGPWPAARLHLYWRFLETRDESFPYAETLPPPQGLWNIYGLGLPDDVLRKVYHENAMRIIPGVRERVESFQRRVD